MSVRVDIDFIKGTEYQNLIIWCSTFRVQVVGDTVITVITFDSHVIVSHSHIIQ